MTNFFVVIVAILVIQFGTFLYLLKLLNKKLDDAEKAIISQVVSMPISIKRVAENIESSAKDIKGEVKKIKKFKEEDGSDGRI